MSQIIKSASNSSSSINFVTDSGTVIPSSGIVNLNGATTTSYNSNGIQVIANPNGSNNAIFELTNRAVGTVTTTDTTITTIITLPLIVSGALYSIEGYVGGYIPATNNGGSYFFDSSIKTNGVIATEIGTNYTTVLEDAPMAPSDIFVNVTGNNVIIQVQGIASTTIHWVAKFEYTRVS